MKHFLGLSLTLSYEGNNSGVKESSKQCNNPKPNMAEMRECYSCYRVNLEI